MFCRIILVNWKRAIDTCACIASLEQSVNIDWQAVICENGSPDGSGSVLREFLAHHYVEQEREVGEFSVFDYYDTTVERESMPRVMLVLSTHNLGLAGGCNLACRIAKQNRTPDYWWFLNNDTEVEPETLCRMVQRMQQDSSIGICGSTLVYAHDRKTLQACGGAVYFPWSGLIHEIGQGRVWPCDVDAKAIEASMRYVSGASMLVSRAFFESVGEMCTDYFLYYEELDWAERGRRAGFRLGYAPDAVVYHKEGAVLGSGRSSKRSMLAEYYGLYNRLRVTRKFFPWALPTVYLVAWLQTLRRALQGYGSRARMMAAVLLGMRRTPPEA